MNVEDSFARLLGRQPTETEKANLYRVRDALGLRNNDALWLVLLALEWYDGRLRKYPAEVAEAAQKAGRELEALVRVAVREEIQSARSEARARAVGATGPAWRWIAVAIAAALLVVFGAFCMVVGYHFATDPFPFWAQVAAGGDLAGRVAVSVLAAPTGWIVFALLVPCAGYTSKIGWVLAHNRFAARWMRVAGWALMAVAGSGTATSAIVLARLLGPGR